MCREVVYIKRMLIFVVFVPTSSTYITGTIIFLICSSYGMIFLNKMRSSECGHTQTKSVSVFNITFFVNKHLNYVLENWVQLIIYYLFIKNYTNEINLPNKIKRLFKILIKKKRDYSEIYKVV